MAEKKYYWVKLKDIFFDDKRIKILRKSKDGYRFICIYLMMQLKAIKTDGMFQYSGVLSDFIDEISVIIGEPKNIVKKSLEIFEKLGLIEVLENSSLFLSEVPEIIEYGGEQASAERVRKYREKQKALQCNSEVTAEKQKSNTDIESDLELDIEKEIESDRPDQTASLSSSGLVPYPQSVAEVREYCIQMGFTKVDPAAFFNYYEERNWMTGGKPVENWHALVKHWNETQREFNEPVQEQPKQAEEFELHTKLWFRYTDLEEDGEIGECPIPPTSMEEMLKCYEDYSGYGPLVTEFYNYFNSKGWKVCGWKIRDWKLAFLIWLRFKNGGLEAKQIEQRMDNEKFSSIDSMFFCTEEERNKVKEKLDWRAIAAR